MNAQRRGWKDTTKSGTMMEQGAGLSLMVEGNFIVLCDVSYF